LEAGSLPPEEGIVLGRVRVMEGGEEQWLSLLGESKFGLVLLPGDPSQAVYVPLKDEGSFAWHLPAGRYTISSFEWRSHGVLTGRVFATFDVRRDEAVYIGTLSILFTGNRYSLGVVDDYGAAVEDFAQRFPDVDRVVDRRLMCLEEKR
jgi:hypothetical protein